MSPGIRRIVLLVVIAPQGSQLNILVPFATSSIDTISRNAYASPPGFRRTSRAPRPSSATADGQLVDAVANRGK